MMTTTTRITRRKKHRARAAAAAENSSPLDCRPALREKETMNDIINILDTIEIETHIENQERQERDRRLKSAQCEN
jgi:hypothetical protein